MKEITKDIHKSFGPVLLTKEDIVILYNKISKLNDDPNNKDVNRRRFYFTIDDFLLDSIEEIPNLKQKKSGKINFTYYTFDGYNFNLEIDKTGARYFVINPTPYILGICSEIDQIINSKKRKMMWTENLQAMLIFLFSSAIFFSMSNEYKNQIYFYIGIFLGAITLLDIILFLVFIPYRKTKINLEENGTPFWIRNKDQILLNIFIFFLGIIGTIIAQKIISK
jgi:hypothetical protein